MCECECVCKMIENFHKCRVEIGKVLIELPFVKEIAFSPFDSNAPKIVRFTIVVNRKLSHYAKLSLRSKIDKVLEDKNFKTKYRISTHVV